MRQAASSAHALASSTQRRVRGPSSVVSTRGMEVGMRVPGYNGKNDVLGRARSLLRHGRGARSGWRLCLARDRNPRRRLGILLRRRPDEPPWLALHRVAGLLEISTDGRELLAK